MGECVEQPMRVAFVVVEKQNAALRFMGFQGMFDKYGR